RQCSRLSQRGLSVVSASACRENVASGYECRRAIVRGAISAGTKVFVGFPLSGCRVTHAKIKRRPLVQQFAVGQQHPGVAGGASSFMLEFKLVIVIASLAMEIAKSFKRIAKPGLEIERLATLERELQM